MKADSYISGVKLKVVGRVQGVFYRQCTKDKARALALSGWVANSLDGSVLVEARGSRPALEELISWCRQGPPSARVTAVEIEWLPDETVSDAGGSFEVRFEPVSADEA